MNFGYRGGRGPKFRRFLICQLTAINKEPIITNLRFFSLLKKRVEMIKNSKHRQIQIKRSIYSTI